MDPQEDTKKTGPDQEQQTGQPATERKSEPARKCQICEGPNHRGCGCEARAAKEKSRIDLNALPKIHYAIDGRPFCNEAQRGAMQPGEKTTENENEATCQACRDLLEPKAGPEHVQPESKELEDDNLEDILTGPIIGKQYEANLNTADGIASIVVLLYDTNNYLKLIAGDLITIRKHLSKEEVKNAVENQN